MVRLKLRPESPAAGIDADDGDRKYVQDVGGGGVPPHEPVLWTVMLWVAEPSRAPSLVRTVTATVWVPAEA